MTRIVGGTAGGRPLQVPDGHATRPTADRAREALVSALDSLVGLAGARVADLYAGSGAVGLECASRGASAVLLVESDARAVTAIRANVATVGVAGVRVVAGSVGPVLAAAPDAPFDVVFLDPPYALPVAADLAALVEHGWVAADGVVVAERSTRDPALVWPAGLQALRDRRYGEATLWYGRPS